MDKAAKTSDSKAAEGKKDSPAQVDTAGSLVLFLMHQYQSYLDRTVVQYGVRGRHAPMLIHLSLGNGADTQNDLARQLGVDKGTVSRTVVSLAEQGLVEQTTNVKDSRGIRVQLTERGVEVAERIADLAEDWADEVMKGIPKPARAQVLQQLRLMADQAEALSDRTRAAIPPAPQRRKD